MAINVPTDVQVTPSSGLINPAMAKQPMLRALENLNYLNMFHCPALVDLCPTSSGLISTSSIHWPIRPSADGLRYEFQVRFMTNLDRDTDVTVSTCTAYSGVTTAWNQLFTATTKPTANVLEVYTDDAVIPPDVVALKLDVASVGGVELMVHHWLVRPAPTEAECQVEGVRPSGFTLFDDSILNLTAGSPMHTEFLNRCKISSLALLGDRWQQVYSFGQEGPSNPQYAVPWTIESDTKVIDQAIKSSLRGVPPGIVQFYVIATKSGGSEVGVVSIRLYNKGGPQVSESLLDSDGSIQNATPFYVVKSQDDTLRVFMYGSKPVGADKLYIHAVSAYWRPF